ncbi:gibberellin-regulated protein 1-like [Juglans microcarpa x Juglans regia]|uniref:gibberellin-regulated protein 1-like n=1 Tax=Juglans microcarpa x Juglans regia TaxID=2249226 RepID=UPI001B7F1159|nr:gibberellin-regulated protein 1-like [Juglans microcarpa x Juglans regia]
MVKNRDRKLFSQSLPAAMAISKTLIIPLVISLLLLHDHAESYQKVITTKVECPSSQNIDCGAACDARCQLSSRPHLCKRACGTCCARCDCVPPGTSGNYDACPCYANMTTHGGRRKCP